MNRSSCLYRLIKPKLSSSSSFGVLKRLYHTNVPIGSINTDVLPWTNTYDITSCQMLGTGIILLKNYLSLLGQADIWNICDKWGVGPGGFYQPISKDVDYHTMSFGRNWDPVTGYKYRYRNEVFETPLLPYQLIQLAARVFTDAKAKLHQLPFQEMCPDTCLVEYYYYPRYGLHQDCDESSISLMAGLPVISIFIGDTVEFWYGYTRDEDKLSRIWLESGDVLIYGGKSRLIFHRVKEVHELSSPRQLCDATMSESGCLNLSLRQF